MAMTLTSDDLIAIHGAIHIDVRDGADTNPGTSIEPVQTVAAARAAADTAGVKEYRIRGAITLDDDHDRWTIRGLSAGFFDEVNLAGFGVDEARFESLKLKGTCDNSEIEAKECQLSLVSGAYGLFRVCSLLDTFFADNANAARTYIFERCFSGVAGVARPVIDLDQAAAFTHSIQFRNYTGGLITRNMDLAHNMSIDLLSGTAEFEATCTAGVTVLRGVGEEEDNSNGMTLHDFLVHGSELKLARKLLQNKSITDPTTGKMTVADDDGTALVEGDIFEDAAGVTAYGPNSTKIERRERLE